MRSPSEVWNELKKHGKEEWKTAFWAAVLLGLLIHMPIMLRDIPNHDGLGSLYFDQNMITSGRWFLTVACGFSSYFNLPWLIGLLALLYLGLGAVVLVDFLEVHSKGCIVVISGLLVSFPALASTFAYVFTMDGYMMAVLFAVLAPAVTKRFRNGFWAGAVFLALSMGIYQAYLPFAVLLSIYGIVMLLLKQNPWKEVVKEGLKYLYMGVLGCSLYLAVLQILLKVQGKVLDTYQGISGMGTVERAGLLDTVVKMYQDFAAFTVKGGVLCHNTVSFLACIALVIAAAGTVISLAIKRKWWKKFSFYVIVLLLAAGLPPATNLILLISPQVTYHLLMRYQWVVFLILMIAFTARYTGKAVWQIWTVLAAGASLVFCFALADQIAYSNLEKRYEKTYAYCVRLLDRIETTDGYYQGIPIAMVGVVGDDEFPVTDITGKVTASMIGITGDSLLYTGENYRIFMKNYLGATLNILPPEAMSGIYSSEEYRAMDSFPGDGSIRIIDGVMYVKTENVDWENAVK